MKKKLDQYTGRLSPAQIAVGINAAEANARRMLDDATSLLELKRYPTAAALAVLSIEESGKVSILRSLALARNDAELREAWKDYRLHTKKNVQWILPTLVADGARRLEDLRPLFDPASDHPFVLEQVKQIALYTDCLGAAHWSEPGEVVDELLARTLVEGARMITHAPRTVSAQEIALWIEYIGPVWKGPMEWMKKAVAAWHEEAVKRGLILGRADAMAEFVGHGDPEQTLPREESGS